MSEMPIENDHLPANHQNIDNIPEVDEAIDAYADELTVNDVLTDPSSVVNLSNNHLGKLYEMLEAHAEEVSAAMVEIKKTIFDNMEADSEEAGNYLCFYQERKSFPELTLERAKDLGFVKIEEKIDTSRAKKAYEAGADLGKVDINRIPIMKKKKVEEMEE